MLAPRGACVRDGDTVLCFFGHNDLRPLTIRAGETLNCKIGRFKHSEFIGQQFGTRVTGEPNERAVTTKPKLLILQPSADLWTLAVPHRTQIIYSTDIAMIITHLRLRPGSVVCEAGTGSGSLSHCLARAVAPTGRVFTFDFHRGRALEAKGEFERNGVQDVVTNGWRDACSTSTTADGKTGLEDAEASAPLPGFGLPAASVDAVFLDLPAPWAAVENVLHVLRPNGVLCTFSPCIEQTQRTCERLRSDALDFVDIRTVEALTKQFEPVKRRVAEGDDGSKGHRIMFKPAVSSKGHSAYLTFARRRLPPLTPDEASPASPPS